MARFTARVEKQYDADGRYLVETVRVDYDFSGVPEPLDVLEDKFRRDIGVIRRRKGLLDHSDFREPVGC